MKRWELARRERAVLFRELVPALIRESTRVVEVFSQGSLIDLERLGGVLEDLSRRAVLAGKKDSRRVESMITLFNEISAAYQHVRGRDVQSEVLRRAPLAQQLRDEAQAYEEFLRRKIL